MKKSTCRTGLYIISGCFLVLLIAALPVAHLHAADTPPVPQRKMSVEQLEELLSYEKEQKKELAEKLEDIEKELKRTKSKLVGLTENVQEQEKKLQTLETDLEKLRTERKEIKDRLEGQYGSISKLALALQRLRRMPPEALIMRPDPPIKTARSALLLQSMLPSIYQRAENLAKNLDRLDVLAQEIEHDKKIVDERKSGLDREYADMREMVKKRERLYRATQSNYKERMARIDRLAKESKSLQELMEKLEKSRREQEQKEAEKKIRQERTASQKTIPKKTIPYLPGGGGVPRLPIAGTIKTGYGAIDPYGSKSEGLTIEGRNGAVVVAPMAGTVRFTRDFQRYGKTVIIEHSDGYYSVVAGLARIDTVVGQKMDSGEPIGLLMSVNDRNPTLYYELRYNNQPVPPSRKIAGLG